MILEEILLRNFRNYSKLKLTFDEKVNLILGPNGVGKSNLLESIYILGFGRSPWANQNNDVINFDQTWSTICGKAKDRNVEVKVKFMSGGKKKAEINNKTVKSLSELLGVFTETLIGHEEINLVRGSPSFRRKLMDMHISQTDPEYIQRLNKFNKAVLTRNKIMEKLSFGGVVGGKVLLSSWNDIMIENGVYLMLKRAKFIEQILANCREYYNYLSEEKEILDIQYSPSFTYNEDTIVQDYEDKLAKESARELRYASSFYGPHRDDLKIALNGRSMKRFGSWGQSRATSIAILLASAKVLENYYDCKPILLLDDCFTDLDEYHSQRLFELAPQIGQTFITSPREMKFSDNSTGIVYRIHHSGMVEKKL